MRGWIAKQPGAVFGARHRVRLVDGTRVKEPGPTGSSWCIHYSIELPTLACCDVKVQDKHGSGETFKKFDILPNDLMIGDRATERRPALGTLSAMGTSSVRFAWNLLPLWHDEDRASTLPATCEPCENEDRGLGSLSRMANSDEGRVCALKKTGATDAAIQKIKRAAQKHGSKPRWRPLKLQDM
jgi:hypothetical protein